MKGLIRISAPYTQRVESDIFGSAVRIAADVEMTNPNTGINETRPLFFEFERRFEQYLCPERSDAFVMGLLSTALENGDNIEFTAPMSETLYYHLSDEYIPAITKYYRNFPLFPIKLIGPKNTQNYSCGGGGKVAIGCSCGVDSLYTLSAKLHTSIERFNASYLFTSSSGTEDIDPERIRALYCKIYNHTKELATFCGIDCIGCWNNLYTFYKFPYMAFDYFHASTFSSSAYAIQKLIGIYHHNSTYSIEEMDASKNDFTKSSRYDGSYMDLFDMPRMSSETLTVYSTGSDKTRIEKEAAISDFEPAQKFLSVCGIEYGGAAIMEKNNCSRCKKCVRTMSGFYAMGKLENFREVFDVEDYKKHLGRRLGKWFAFEHGGFVRDFKRVARENGVKIPVSAYLWHWFVFGPLSFLRNHLRTLKFARRVYFKLGLDKKIFGYRGAVAKKEMEGEK